MSIARSVRILITLALISGVPGPVLAATFTVNTTVDAVDATPGDGVCATAGALCTLRAAIQEANALAGSDTIVVPAGTYTLTIAGTGENAAATGDLDITTTIVIEGSGPDITTIDANSVDRVFEVRPGGNATLRGLHITGGSPGASNGGGVSSNGTLLIERCAIDGNTAGLSGGGVDQGGGTLTVNDSTISGNTASSIAGVRTNTGTSFLTNVTISGNSATGGGPGGVGGPAGTQTLTNSTVAFNTAPGGLAGNMGGSALMTFRNSLTLTSGGINCVFGGGSFTNGGGNFAAGAACDTLVANAAVTANLGALTVNAPGKTATHALLAGNPAIGAGGSAFCPGADQRGVTRAGVACDSGAYQFTAAATSSPTPSPTTGPPVLTAIPDQIVPQNGSTTVSFSISGAIIAYALRVSATSSNPALFPEMASSVACTQVGACILRLTPADGRSGSATVTVTVTDGALAAVRSFTAAVATARPTAPEVVLANTIGSGVVLTWSEPAGGLPMAYAITWGTTPTDWNLPMQLVAATDGRFEFSALPAGTYYFRVQAIGTSDLSPASPPATATVTTSAAVPGPPQALQVAASNSGLQAWWRASFIGAAPTLYDVQIGTALGRSDVADPTVPEPSLNATPGAGSYWVRTRAMTGGAVGAWSSSVQVPVGSATCTSAPGTPILLPVTTSASTANLTWWPGPGDVAATYELQLAPGAGLAPIRTLATDGPGTSVVWTPFTGRFAVRIAARNACGTSVRSNEVSFTVRP
jgi:CSLREA domain-containing protein